MLWRRKINLLKCNFKLDATPIIHMRTEAGITRRRIYRKKKAGSYTCKVVKRHGYGKPTLGDERNGQTHVLRRDVSLTGRIHLRTI